MKVTRVLTLAGLVAFLACGGDDSTGPSGNGESGMSATINGASWSAEALLSSAQYNETDDLLVLIGLNTSTYSIAINVDDLTTTGTYDLTDTFPLRFAVVTTNAGGSWTSTTAAVQGTVTLSTFSQNRAVGTFSFDAEAVGTSTVTTPLSVTNGQFDLELNRLTP